MTCTAEADGRIAATASYRVVYSTLATASRALASGRGLSVTPPRGIRVYNQISFMYTLPGFFFFLSVFIINNVKNRYTAECIRLFFIIIYDYSVWR